MNKQQDYENQYTEHADDCEDTQPCVPWGWLLLLLAPLALLLITFLIPLPDRLVLADNTSQPLVDGNWTDVYYDQNLITSPRWSHPEAPVGPNAEITSLIDGTYNLYIALHPQVALGLFSISACGLCPCSGNACTVTSDCCDPFSFPVGEASFCNPNSLTCQTCPNTGDACVDDSDCCPSFAGPNVSTYCYLGTCRACRETGESCAIFPDESAFCCTDVNAFCGVPSFICQPAPPTEPPPPPDAPCGLCPCDGQPCFNESDCCDPYYYSAGSLCTVIDEDTNSSVCLMCGFRAEGDPCNSDSECDCNGTSLTCQALPPFGFTFCEPPTAAPTAAPTPPYGPSCANQSQCTDTQYCSPNLNLCVTCASIHQSCTQDPLYQCNCSGGNATNGLFCWNETNRCEALCSNVSQCPDDYYCPVDAYSNETLCANCGESEGPICCNTTDYCLAVFGNDTYCSPTTGTCETCAFYNQSCALDPPNACGCNASDNLFCDPETLLCAMLPPTPAPTAAPTPAPLCPPTPTIYARLMRQRAPNPAFVPLGAPFVPLVSGAMHLVTTAVTTEAGDVLKVQWMSPDCPFMALTPVAFDLGLIGVPAQGIKDISAYFVATNL